MSELIWNCRDGRKLRVSEMETAHIQSALAMLKRKGFIGQRHQNAYMCTPDLADGAMMCFEQEQDHAFRSPVHPAIDTFEAELKRRGSKELDWSQPTKGIGRTTMHRSELNQIAHGLKAANPGGQKDIEGSPERASYETWVNTVKSVAGHLQLKDKALSNFLAVSGLRPEEVRS